MTTPEQPSVAASMGTLHFLPTGEESLAVCTTEAQLFHMKAKDQFVHDWQDYQDIVQETDWTVMEKFVKIVASNSGEITDEQSYKRVFREATREIKIVPAKPLMIAAYYRLLHRDEITKSPALEKYMLKKSIRSNSGVVVITVVTAPGPFSCPQDCHYCPNEPGQPRSYLSTEPAVARANQNKFDPVRQIYDRAATLAKQGHEIDKLEIIVLGGTWSGYPAQYQEDFCRDIFYAANTFNEELAKARLEGKIPEILAQLKSGEISDPQERHLDDQIDNDMWGVALQLSHLNKNQRPRLSLIEEQNLNETADCKVIGLTLETRPDHISIPEIRRLRLLGCTRVQIGVQHTDDEVLKFINRGHSISDAVKALALLKQSCFKVDIHLMPDLPSSSLEKDLEMFDFVLNTEHLQADHWKVYPCEVTPFTLIEQWYADGSYMPYTETNPEKLVQLLVSVKARVSPWIRLNRVIRDIPKESIIAGNANTNLRQEIFKELTKIGSSCKCIRCREVRDWPDRDDTIMVRRNYRSSEGDEIFLTIEGTGDRGLGGGAEARGLNHKNGKPVAGKMTKQQKRVWKQGKRDQEALIREQRASDRLVKEQVGHLEETEHHDEPVDADHNEQDEEEHEEFGDLFEDDLGVPVDTIHPDQPKTPSSVDSSLYPIPMVADRTMWDRAKPSTNDNAPLYALLRLRFNDDPEIAPKVFPELKDCALIRELHVYGTVATARPSNEPGNTNLPQHFGFGKRLMAEAERIAIERGYKKIAVISGIGVRNYYRKRGYRLQGLFMVKDLVEEPCRPVLEPYQPSLPVSSEPSLHVSSEPSLKSPSPLSPTDEFAKEDWNPSCLSTPRGLEISRFSAIIEYVESGMELVSRHKIPILLGLTAIVGIFSFAKSQKY